MPRTKPAASAVSATAASSSRQMSLNAAAHIGPDIADEGRREKVPWLKWCDGSADGPGGSATSLLLPRRELHERAGRRAVRPCAQDEKTMAPARPQPRGRPFMGYRR